MLCHVCGSTTFEQLDESHIRCVECGHGATFTRLVAVANPSPSPTDIARGEELFRDIDARTLGAFTRATFLPFALDHRWRGLRRFDGHGGNGDRTTSLTLAFGEDVRDLKQPEIHVETRVPAFDLIGDPTSAATMDAFMLARTQVDHLWRQTGVLRDDVRRSVFPRDGVEADDPTALWERASLTVDHDLVDFAVLSEGEHWVAQAIVGNSVVGIQARNWTPETTGLVTEKNFDPYREGAKEMRRRMTP
jgi:hypothetical protein